MNQCGKEFHDGTERVRVWNSRPRSCVFANFAGDALFGMIGRPFTDKRTLFCYDAAYEKTNRIEIDFGGGFAAGCQSICFGERNAWAGAGRESGLRTARLSLL